MQSEIDWTTGGLRFYEADPSKTENLSDFTSDASINKHFDPIPSAYPSAHSGSPSRTGSSSSTRSATRSSAPTT